ncbi:MAG TPA: lactonase family protein [Chitinophagaceae bacterium]|nr:lactonase family protein [Chitinophagaceae bacterium]
MRILLVILLFVSQVVSGQSSGQSYYLFASSYTTHGSKGIYVFQFDGASGKLRPVDSTKAGSIKNPTFIELSSNNKVLYAGQETGGKDTAYINAYSFDRAKGKLTLINKQRNGGDGPCYIAITKDNKWVVVANYGGGSITAFKANPDGSLQPFSQSIQHEGKGAIPRRQEKPHVHATVFSPDEKYLISPDLGVDKVFVYTFQPSMKEPLQAAEPPYVETAPGTGPRHFTFHSNGRFAYLIQEMGGNVLAYRYDNGKLSLFQTISAHAADFKGTIGSADIHISPDGKFLYASNRGDANTVAIYSIDQKSGELTLKNIQSSLGKTPRNFVIDPTGKFVFVANQETNNIVVFKRDLQTGLLQPTGEQATVPDVTCVKLMK